MEYDVIIAETKQELVYLVNKAIADGWEPQGGVLVRSYDIKRADGYSNTYFNLYQAMIRQPFGIRRA